MLEHLNNACKVNASIHACENARPACGHAGNVSIWIADWIRNCEVTAHVWRPYPSLLTVMASSAHCQHYEYARRAGRLVLGAVRNGRVMLRIVAPVLLIAEMRLNGRSSRMLEAL